MKKILFGLLFSLLVLNQQAKTCRMIQPFKKPGIIGKEWPFLEVSP
jgi:hypothetical protein